MSDSVDRVFVHALNTVKKIPRTGSARPPTADRLKLYGLYKQSMEGNVEGVMDRPVGDGADVQAESQKWDAWYSQRNLSRTEAKRRYITTLIETMHKYAVPTPDAQELISELEFVWDQIKSNTSSSSSSSPVQALGMPPQTQSYGSIGDRISRAEGNGFGNGRDSRLRVLSPVSQPEDDMSSRRYGATHPEEEDDEEEEDEEEDFQEARNTPFEEEEEDGSDNGHLQPSNIHNNDPHNDIRNRRWRRRVEQALTKVSVELAAMREQMETRALSRRRRNSLWAWVKWLVWIFVRQVFWDMAILCAVLVWMRFVRGDRRLEEKLKSGLRHVRDRLARIRWLRYMPRFMAFP